MQDFVGLCLSAHFESPVIYTGIIGTDASHHNRPLILLLHLLLEPTCNVRRVIFHYPVLGSQGTALASLKEAAIKARAMEYLDQLRAAHVCTVHEVVELILTWQLPTSWRDCDLSVNGAPQSSHMLYPDTNDYDYTASPSPGSHARNGSA